MAVKLSGKSTLFDVPNPDSGSADSTSSDLRVRPQATIRNYRGQPIHVEDVVYLGLGWHKHDYASTRGYRNSASTYLFFPLPPTQVLLTTIGPSKRTPRLPWLCGCGQAACVGRAMVSGQGRGMAVVGSAPFSDGAGGGGASSSDRAPRLMSRSIWPATSGLSRRKLLEFSRPWPSLVSPKE